MAAEQVSSKKDVLLSEPLFPSQPRHISQWSMDTLAKTSMTQFLRDMDIKESFISYYLAIQEKLQALQLPMDEKDPEYYTIQDQCITEKMPMETQVYKCFAWHWRNEEVQKLPVEIKSLEELGYTTTKATELVEWFNANNLREPHWRDNEIYDLRTLVVCCSISGVQTSIMTPEAISAIENLPTNTWTPMTIPKTTIVTPVTTIISQDIHRCPYCCSL